MEFSEFLRVYPLRSPNIMWFLGAGASAAAGVPTAGELVWEFKRSLYCSRQRVPRTACADLADPRLRRRLQTFFDADGAFPADGADDEYSAYFEAAYPDESDRRRIIDDAVRGATPSFGHLALASLLKLRKAAAIWTTNFDAAVEDAVARIFGSQSALTVADTERAGIATEAINEARWPFLAKLHGDFRSRRLKNTPSELRAQDQQIRRALIESCRRWGLAVIGYSGRDASVMEALEEALSAAGAFPFGLFWFRRPGDPTTARVERLIASATAAGGDAAILEVPTFDEAVGDILAQMSEIPTEIEEALRSAKPRISTAPIAQPGSSWPAIRLNALPIKAWPTSCRLVVSKVGGDRAVRDAIEKAGADVIAVARRFGVLCFGRDVEIRRAFEPFRIERFDLHPIEPKRLGFESPELRLLYSALARGLVHDRPLVAHRARIGWTISVDCTRGADPRLQQLNGATRGLGGQIPGTSLCWSEGVRLRLELVGDRLWLVFIPTMWSDSVPTDGDSGERRHAEDARDEFIRERLAKRYNRMTSEIIDAWARLLADDNSARDVSAFGIGDGVDATFTLGSVTAYSMRSKHGGR